MAENEIIALGAVQSIIRSSEDFLHPLSRRLARRMRLGEIVRSWDKDLPSVALQSMRKQCLERELLNPFFDEMQVLLSRAIILYELSARECFSIYAGEIVVHRQVNDFARGCLFGEISSIEGYAPFSRRNSSPGIFRQEAGIYYRTFLAHLTGEQQTHLAYLVEMIGTSWYT